MTTLKEKLESWRKPYYDWRSHIENYPNYRSHTFENNNSEEEFLYQKYKALYPNKSYKEICFSMSLDYFDM